MSDEELLRSLVRESISENRTIKISSGKKIEEGSRRHLQEIDRIVSELDLFRKNLGRRFRKERYTVSRCIESMRFLRNKLKREGLRAGLLSETD